VPTAKALRFHRRAVEILRQCEAASAEFRAREHDPPPHRLGVLPTLASRDVAAVVAALDRAEAGWRLRVREADSADLASGLRRGRVDMAWTAVEEDAAHARVLWREDFVAFVGPDHRLARHRSTGVSVRDLDGERLVLRASCELPGGRLREAGVTLRPAARAVRDELALRLVAAGLGIAIAPRSLALDGAVLAVSVHDLGIQRSIGLVWRPEVPEDVLDAVLAAIIRQTDAAGL
jgi:DNA-binding transcriptional LysR family regulator